MCQLVWIMRCPDIWGNIISGCVGKGVSGWGYHVNQYTDWAWVGLIQSDEGTEERGWVKENSALPLHSSSSHCLSFLYVSVSVSVSLTLSFFLTVFKMGYQSSLAFRLRLGLELYLQLPWVFNSPTANLGFLSLHNHMSQLLLINLFTYTYVYLLLFVFLWRTPTNKTCLVLKTASSMC